MVLLMLASVVGAIAVTWVLNRTFLEDYYLYSKMDMLDEVFREVHGVIERAEQEAATSEDSSENSDGFPVDEFGNIGEEEEQIRLILSDIQRLELDVQALRNDVSIWLPRIPTQCIFLPPAVRIP